MDDYGLNDDGTSMFDTGLGGGYFGYPGSGDGSGFAPQPITFGPDSSMQIGGGNYDFTGGSTIPGTGGANLGVPGDGSSGDSSGGWASALLRMLGMGPGQSSSQGLATILALLGAGGSALLNSNASKQAAAQMQQAVTNANNAATGVFQKQGGMYAPYYDAGVSAINRMAAMPPSNLAADFSPLGTGRGIKLGALAGH